MLSGVLHGEDGFVVVSGEAGIGKTSLVEALAGEARTHGAAVLTGGCYDLTITPPYGPWQDALDRYAAGNDLLDIPAVFSHSSAAAMESQELFEHVRGFLAKIAAVQPVVIVLEDLHWADTASLDLLRAVGRRRGGLALLLVATWRDDEQSRDQSLDRVLPALVRETHALRIALPRLAKVDTREIIARRYSLSEKETDGLTEWVQRRAEGNPFFTGEVLLALEQNGTLHTDGNLWHFNPPADFGVPPLVRQVIERRLSPLHEQTHRVLEIAAIIGHEASVDIVQAVAGATDLELASAMDEALEAGVIVETNGDEGTFLFRHALMRETLYQQQSILRRRSRHRRVAEIMVASPVQVPGALGFHFQAANDHRAVEWLALAGTLSLSQHAPDDAIAHLTRAGELASRFGIQFPREALRTRGRAWEMVGDHARAREDYETCLRAARETGDRDGERQALLDLGALWSERDYEHAGTAFQQALVLAQKGSDESALAHCLNAVGNWYVNNDEAHLGLRYHRAALEILTRIGDQSGIAATRDVLAMAHYVAGDLQRAATEYEQAVRSLDEIGDRQRLSSALATWAATGGNYETEAVAVADGSHADWLSMITRSRAVAREIGWLAGEAYAEIVTGEMLGPRGDVGEALARAGTGLALAERIGHQQWITAGQLILGRIHAEILDDVAARAHLESALSQARAIRSRLWTTLSAAALGSLLIEMGDVEAAGATLEKVLDDTLPAKSLFGRSSWLAWARLRLARGEPDEALRAVDQLLKHPDTAGLRQIPWVAHSRGDALAELGRLAEAEAAYVAARRGALDRDMRHLLWRTELALVRLLASQGREDERQDALRRAEATLREIAATMPSEEARTMFLQRASKRFPAIASAGKLPLNPNGLSPREVEVLRFVAQGLTDAEVAARLFISARTVGRHLQSIYNKVGVGSRTAAAAFAFEHQLLTRPDAV